MEANGTYTFTMLFEPAEEGGYLVTGPALPGLVTEGDTLEKARRMAEDALRGYLESLREDGQSIPLYRHFNYRADQLQNSPLRLPVGF
jgi:antitoxin HicB